MQMYNPKDSLLHRQNALNSIQIMANIDMVAAPKGICSILVKASQTGVSQPQEVTYMKYYCLSALLSYGYVIVLHTYF